MKMKGSLRPAGVAITLALTAGGLNFAGVDVVRAQGAPTSKPVGAGTPTSQPASPGAGLPKPMMMPPHGGGAPASQPAGGAEKSSLPPAPVRPIVRGATPVKSVTLRAFHRVFHDFVDDNATAPYRAFPVGDTDYTAEVVEYVPDFALNLKTRAVISRSQEPNNPAVRVLVLQKGVPQDTVWAMLSMPPHFARNSLLAFQIRRLELKNRAPILPPVAPAGGAAAPKPPMGQKVKGAKTP